MSKIMLHWFISIFLVSYVDYALAFKPIMQNQERDFAVLAADGDGVYIYLKSDDYTNHSKVNYFISTGGREVEFLMGKERESIYGAGIIETEKGDKIAFLVDKKERIVFIKSIHQEKVGEIRRIPLPNDVGFIKKVVSTKEEIAVISEFLFGSHIHVLNTGNWTVKKQDYESVNEKSVLYEVEDYWADDAWDYVVFLDKSLNRVVFCRYYKDGKLMSKIDYAPDKKIMDLNIDRFERGKLWVFKQDVEANSFAEFMQTESSLVSLIEVDFTEGKIAFEELFTVRHFDSPNIIDNIIFCNENDLYYAVEFGERSAHLISNSEKKKQKIALPEKSFPESYFFTNGSKLGAYINYEIGINRYLNDGFGAYFSDITCK